MKKIALTTLILLATCSISFAQFTLTAPPQKTAFANRAEGEVIHLPLTSEEINTIKTVKAQSDLSDDTRAKIDKQLDLGDLTSLHLVPKYIELDLITFENLPDQKQEIRIAAMNVMIKQEPSAELLGHMKRDLGNYIKKFDSKNEYPDMNKFYIILDGFVNNFEAYSFEEVGSMIEYILSDYRLYDNPDIVKITGQYWSSEDFLEKIAISYPAESQNIFEKALGDIFDSSVDRIATGRLNRIGDYDKTIQLLTNAYVRTFDDPQQADKRVAELLDSWKQKQIQATPIDFDEIDKKYKEYANSFGKSEPVKEATYIDAIKYEQRSRFIKKLKEVQ